VVAAAVAVAVFCPVARASYTVYGCALPNGAPAPLDGWTLSATADAKTHDWCAPSLAPAGLPPALYVGLDSAPVPVGSRATAAFTAPSSTVIVGGTLFRFFGASGGASNRNVTALADLSVVLSSCTSVTGCTTAGSLDMGTRFLAVNRVVLPHTRLHQLAVQAQCDPFLPAPDPAFCPEAPGLTGGTALIYGTQIALADVSAPRFVGTPHGSLLQPQISDIGSVTVDVSDAGGGVAKMLLLADGRVVRQQSVNPGGSCRAPYVHTVPCPLSAHVTMDFNTRDLSEGPHRLSVGVEDVGGNRTVSGLFSVTVANASGPNGIQASRAATLSGHFVGGGRVSYGRRARLVGRLVNSAGGPIGSARLEVLQRTRLAGAPWRPAGTAVTNAAGHFAIRLGRGPSRDVRVVYRAFAADAVPAAQLQGRLLVRAGVRLRVTPRRVRPNGRIRFAGSLLGGPGRAGELVTLYVFAGRRIPVAVLRTDRRGRFGFAYRFSRTFVPTTFPFWAQVEAQHGFPYIRGRSRRVLVRVL
jgi:hypothetical protein